MTPHKLRLWALSLLIYTGAGYAEDLSFRILERGSGTPIEGATVVVESSGDYDTTNRQGEVTLYALDLPARVKALAMGYEPQLLTLNSPDTSPIEMFLLPVAVEGEGLEVVEERIEEKTSKVTLSAEELRYSPGTQGDPLKAVQSMPGVVSGNDGGGQFFVRGSSAQDNVVWVNQLPVSYLYHWGGMKSTINPDLVDDFNIFLGGFPVEYGEYLGGAIDIQLREPKSDRMHYSASISMLESSVLAEGPTDGADGPGSFAIAARRSYIDLLLSPDDVTNLLQGEDDETENYVVEVPEFYDMQALYHHKLDDGAFDLLFTTAGDSLSFYNNDSKNTDPELVGEFGFSSSYSTLGGRWRKQLNAANKLDMAFGYRHQESQFQIGTDPATGESYYVDESGDTLFIRPQLNWQSSDKNSWTFGIEAYTASYPIDLYIGQPPSETDPIYDLTGSTKYRIDETVNVDSLALFTKLRRRWNERWTTGLGLRQNYAEATGGILLRGTSPQLSAEYNLSDSTTLLGSWGLYHQTPQGFELIEGFGNPKLDYNVAEHRILGVEQQLNPLWSVKLEGYYKPMRDLVVSDDTQPPPDNYRNRGTGKAYGMDLIVKRKRQNRTMGWLSYSFGRSFRTNHITGESYEYNADQPHTLVAVWSQPMSGDWKLWDWGIKLQAHSGKPYTAVTGRHRETPSDPNSRWIPELGEFNGERFDPYIQLDLRFDRRVLHDRWKLSYFIEILNVTNQRNVTRYDYGNDYENYNNPDEVVGLPLFPYFGIEAKF